MRIVSNIKLCSQCGHAIRCEFEPDDEGTGGIGIINFYDVEDNGIGFPISECPNPKCDLIIRYEDLLPS